MEIGSMSMPGDPSASTSIAAALNGAMASGAISTVLGVSAIGL